MTAPVLAHIRSLGYHVSVHELPESLLRLIPACVELHAAKTVEGQDAAAEIHVVKVVGEGELAMYRAACELAAMVGVELEG
jgi:hypothetical protein